MPPGWGRRWLFAMCVIQEDQNVSEHDDADAEAENDARIARFFARARERGGPIVRGVQPSGEAPC